MTLREADAVLDAASFVIARDAVLVLDPETLAVRDANARARDMLSGPATRSHALSLSDLARGETPYDEARLRIELERASRVGSSRFEWRTRTFAGEVIWLDVVAKLSTSETSRSLVVFGEDVTAEKETVEALWRTTAYLTAALDQSPAAILVVDAPSGRVRLTNAAADALRGPKASERYDSAYSIRLRDLDGNEVEGDEHPLARALHTGAATENARYTVEAQPGRVRTVLVHASPIRDGEDAIVAAIAVVSDITDVVRAENAIRERELLVRRLYENVPDVLMSVDERGVIISLSPSVEQVFGFPASKLVDRRFADIGIVDADSLARAEFDRARVLRGEVLPPSEYVYRTASGERRIVEITGSPVDDGRGNRLALFVIRDVTERRAADERRANMEASLRRRQRLEVVGALASGVAHDINNPLTGVLNLAEMLQLGLVGPNELESTGGRIIALSERMGAIVSRLLTLAKPESAESELVDLGALVRDCVDLVGLSLRRARIEVHVELAPSLPRVRCRAQAIEQAVLNLIGNSIDALSSMDASEPRSLVVRTRPVDLGEKPGVRITISDSGPGVDPSIVATMFEPFVSTKSSTVGAGLGLWVGLSVAAEHGGRLHHEPTGERGASFHLDLPADVDVNSALAYRA